MRRGGTVTRRRCRGAVAWLCMTAPLTLLSCVATTGPPATPPVVAARTEAPPAAVPPPRLGPLPRVADGGITLDGRLDEPAWQQALRVELTPPGGPNVRPPAESAVAYLLQDAKHLYCGFEVVDSDVVQEDSRDQQHHYLSGDVVELFLKPADADGYWELYATPAGGRTTFYYPGRGRFGLASNLSDTAGLRTAITVDGTLNDWTDRDRGWTAELAVPLARLFQHTDAHTPEGDAGAGTDWRVALGRYNFSRYLSLVELTAYPRFRRPLLHRYEQWAHLQITPALPGD